MHILYIHQYFTTPSEPGGTRSYWIAKELVKRGHEVTMICSTNKAHLNANKVDVDGICVIYIKNGYSNYMSALRKVWSFFYFMHKAIRIAKQQEKINLVFATSTPLTVGYIAMRLKACRRWPYVFEVRDLWPEFPIQVGAIKNKFIIRILRRFEHSIYAKSEHIIALSPGMKEGVLKTGILNEKCTVIPNMSKPDEFFPHEISQEIVSKFDINLNKFNVIHFGSMGVANGLEYIIYAARELKSRGDDSINFIFLGDGATKPMLEKIVKDNDLENVQFLGNYNMKVVSEIVNCCDVSITSFKKLPILKTNSPNKLFDSLSAGKPIIVNSNGWTKELCEKEDCGFYVDPEKPEELANKLLEIKNDKETLKRWEKNARNLSINVFNRNILSAKVAVILENSSKNVQTSP